MQRLETKNADKIDESNSFKLDPELVEAQVRKELVYQNCQINEVQRELNMLLYNSKVIKSQVFKIPSIIEGEEEKDIKRIDIESVSGRQAYRLAVNSFPKVFADDGMSKKAAFRLPGYIQVNSDNNKEIFALVQSLNKHKDQFKDAVLRLPNAKKKFDVVHDLFPCLVTKQMYRKLHCVEGDVLRAGFFWTQRFVTNKTDKIKVIDKLNKHKKTPPVNSNITEWEEFIKSEISLINELDDDIELRYKRVAKVTPMVNVWTNKNRQFSAHLPIIILGGEPIKVSPLINYDATFKRCVRSDAKIYGAPILERLNLYRKSILK